MIDFTLINGDCLEELPKLIGGGTKVDLVLTDPPYGVINPEWDNIIPIDKMWGCLSQITYDTSPILLFCSQPFTSQLVMSNLEDFKYCFVWDKVAVSNPFLAKKQPMRVHEDIAMFYKKQCYYNPQRVPKTIEGDRTRISEADKKYKEYDTATFGKSPKRHYYVDDGTRLPRTIINGFNSQGGECNSINRFHPTQKPVGLLEWLIKNYTKPNDIVLDFTMGSGSTGVACANTNRKFIGIELDENYYKIAEERIKEAYIQKRLF